MFAVTVPANVITAFELAAIFSALSTILYVFSPPLLADSIVVTCAILPASLVIIFVAPFNTFELAPAMFDAVSVILYDVVPLLPAPNIIVASATVALVFADIFVA